MFKKIFLGFIVLFFLLIGAIVAIPFLFKDEINAKIKEQINKELLADVEYSSYDLSILKSFPDLFFTLNDLSVVGRGEFTGDTLARVKEIGLGLELMKFIRGEELQINSIYIDEANVKAYSIITETGDTIANYDILPPTDSVEDTSSLIDIKVDDFVIKNSNLYFVDVSTGMEVAIKDLNTTSEFKYINDVAEVVSDLNMGSVNYSDLFSGMKMSFEELKTTALINYAPEKATVVSKADFSGLSYNDGSMQMLNKAKVILDLNLDADLVNDNYTLTSTEVSINALKLYVDGIVGLPNENTTYVDLKFNADKSTFKELLSLIPAEYLKDYEGLKASGSFTLNGFAKGNLTETETPAFDVNLAIENGFVQYPDLPSAIENINLNANFKNSTSNLEKTGVNIPNASLKVVGEPINFSLKADNALGDPFIDLKLKGKLDLNRVPEFYPIEGLTKIGGLMDADITFKGLLSDVENEQYEKVDFGGNLLVSNLIYDAGDLPMPVNVNALSLKFSPRDADLVATGLVLGKSDFNVNGRVENIINYVLSDGTIKGNLDLVSNHIDLDELIGDDGSSDESAASTATKVPSNIDFTAQLKAGEVLYDGLTMKNVEGAVAMKDEKVSLNKLNANMLGGTAKINGSYNTKNTDKPEMTFAFDIQKFDIQQTFNYMNTVQAIAPLAKYMTGTFSTDMSLNSLLNNDLSLDLAMLNGLGKVTIPYASFNDLPMFTKISEAIKLPAFNKPALNNAWTVLKFENGQVKVEPFQIKMQDLVMDIEGSNAFDQTINYDIKLNVPSDKFGGAATIANDFLSKQKIPMLNLSVPQSINFVLNVSGPMTSPVVKIVKVSTGASDKGIKDQIMDGVKDQYEQAKQELANKAQAEADKAKAQAQAELDKAKAQAQVEADKAKQKAQDEINKAAEDAKNNIKDKIKGFKW